MDSTSCKVHPDGHGALKNTESKLVVSADDKTIIEMHLSGGNKHDAPEGRISIEKVGTQFEGVPLLADRAYEGDRTRELAIIQFACILIWLK